MAHYYKNDDSLKSEEKTLRQKLLGDEFQFITDNGVFSKSSIDFGSRALISAFDKNDVTGPILDVGCGYGPIGISLAKTYGEKVHMVDVNQRALKLCKRNAELNFVYNVEVYESDALDNVKIEFASILTNPPIRAGKDVVHKIIEQSFFALLPGGELWVVIQKKQGAPSLRTKMIDLFGNCEIVKREKGYNILFSKKDR